MPRQDLSDGAYDFYCIFWYSPVFSNHMPELPEVETVARDLRSKILGARILGVRTIWPKHWSRSPGGFSRFARDVNGRTIRAVRRLGKRVVIELSGGKKLLAHLKMTGNFLWNEAGENNKHIRAVFSLSSGTLYFSDIRKFGRFIYGTDAELFRLKDISRLGPDPLELTSKDFIARFSGRRGRIKQALLNQEIVSGIGNIYADEILHAAGINPEMRVERLNASRIEAISRHAKRILLASIKARGTSMRDFRDTSGDKGNYIGLCKVYGREGKACLRRGCNGSIVRKTVGARSAHFCLTCQKINKKI